MSCEFWLLLDMKKAEKLVTKISENIYIKRERKIYLKT